MTQDSRKIRFGLWYDFRNPSRWRQSADRLYAETLDQIAWAENHGFDDVWLSEHHFIEDGYLPSILPVAAAHRRTHQEDPHRIGRAPDAFSQSRTPGRGYSSSRYHLWRSFRAGRWSGLQTRRVRKLRGAFRERGARTNQSLEIIRRLLGGETVTFKSEFFDFTNVKVMPEPIQKPHPPVWLGGFTPAALRRAARYGDGFTVPGATRDVYDQYVAELKKQNRPTDNIRFASAVWCLVVSNDPEKTFAEAADHVIYQANNYSEWLSAAGLNPLSEHLRDREQLRKSGLLQVLAPDAAVRMIRDLANNVPITHFYSWTLPPGLPPRWSQTHLELFASKVIPAFR